MTSIPILICAAVGSALPLCVFVFLWTKAEARRLSRQMITRDELCERITELQSRIEQVSNEAKQTESKNQAAAWSPEAGSFNLNRRGQILRLHRRGESVAEIASALKVSSGEVKLVLKIQELSTTPAKDSENSLKVSSGTTDKTWETRISEIRE
jgi:hypothetical protein